MPLVPFFDLGQSTEGSSGMFAVAATTTVFFLVDSYNVPTNKQVENAGDLFTHLVVDCRAGFDHFTRGLVGRAEAQWYLQLSLVALVHC
jgi:hypothetical protein